MKNLCLVSFHFVLSFWNEWFMAILKWPCCLKSDFPWRLQTRGYQLSAAGLPKFARGWGRVASPSRRGDNWTIYITLRIHNLMRCFLLFLWDHTTVSLRESLLEYLGHLWVTCFTHIFRPNMSVILCFRQMNKYQISHITERTHIPIWPCSFQTVMKS